MSASEGTPPSGDPSAATAPERLVVSFTRWMVHAGRDYQKRLDDHAMEFLALPAIERARRGAADDEAAIDLARSIIQLVEPVVPQPFGQPTAKYASFRSWLVSLVEDREPSVVLTPDAGPQELATIESFAMHMHWALRHLAMIEPSSRERPALIDAARRAIGRALGPGATSKRGPTSTKAAIDALARLVERAYPSLTRPEIAEVAVRTAVMVGMLDARGSASEIEKAAERAKKRRQRARAGAKAEGVPRPKGRRKRPG